MFGSIIIYVTNEESCLFHIRGQSDVKWDSSSIEISVALRRHLTIRRSLNHLKKLLP